MKYAISNFGTIPDLTKPRCKKKNANTTRATQGHISANVPGDFSSQ